MSLDGHRSALVPDAPVPTSCLQAARPSTNTVTLSALEFDVVWRGSGLGAPPTVLRLASPGRTHTARRRIEAEVWAALCERRPGWGPGAEPDLERLLRLLAEPAIQVEVRAWGTATIRAVLAGGADDSVLAQRSGDAVVLTPCSSLAGATVAVLGTARPGPGRAAVVAAVELEAALRRPTGAGLRADLVDRGVDPAEAGLIAGMLGGIERRAQISVLVPDRLGILRRADEPLEVLDGPRGRYLTIRRRGADSTDWACVGPADDRRLHHRLSEWFAAARAISPGRCAASAADRPP
jgi:ESX secretion-associated protein EspG